MASKNIKNNPRPEINPKLKNLLKSKSVFQEFFKVKKTLNRNSPRYIEPSDTKNDYFDG